MLKDNKERKWYLQAKEGKYHNAYAKARNQAMWEVKTQKFALKRPLQKNLRQIQNLFYRYENKARNWEFSVVWTGAWADIGFHH